MNKQNTIHVLSRGVLIDKEYILLCKTLNLKDPIYFLPGGHIEHFESAEDTVIREFKEETGVSVQIKRFLGCLEYSFDPTHSSICHDHEYNMIFEVSSELLTSDNEVPQLEENIALGWYSVGELSKISLKPEPLVELIGYWLSQPSNDNFKSKMI